MARSYCTTRWDVQFVETCALGITAADLSGIDNDNTQLHETMEAATDLQARAAQAVAEKNLAPNWET